MIPFSKWSIEDFISNVRIKSDNDPSNFHTEICLDSLLHISFQGLNGHKDRWRKTQALCEIRYILNIYLKYFKYIFKECDHNDTNGYIIYKNIPENTILEKLKDI